MNRRRLWAPCEIGLLFLGTVSMLHCGAGGGARSGFGPDDATLNRRGSETMSGSEQTRTFDAQGNSIVSLPTDITVRPFGGVSWALHLDASQRFVNILGENGWEQVMMVGEGYEARYLIPVANSARMGPTDPLVTAVMFLDYTSPPSAALFDVWVAIQRQFAQDVRVVFKFRPGDNDERAMVAAVGAAEAYRQRGIQGFITFSQNLFARTDDLSISHLIDAAARAELSPITFLRVLRYRTHSNFVSADCAQADSIQLREVPTVFVNGRRYIGMNSESWIRGNVEREILLSRARIRAGTRRERMYESVLEPPPALTAVRGAR